MASRRGFLLGSVAAGLFLAGCGSDDDDTPAGPTYTPRGASSAVPAATVTGPIAVRAAPGDASRDYPQLATQAPLAASGYVEEEFFFEGTANRYNTPDQATGSVASSGHPYRSRMLVRRPTNAARFNGIVVVEWVNVTSGYNLDALWQSSSEFFMRNGYAYVGVSAQRVGVQGVPANPALPASLTTWSPTRYGTLDVTAGGTITDDSLSYDVFAQASKAIATPGRVDPLGGLPGRRVLLASGVSQSEGRLVTYHNSIEPLQRLFDGYYLFLGIGPRLRTDLDVKVIKINTENDVLLLREAVARQDDSNVLRTWEIAGTSHVSFQSGAVRTPLLVRDNLPQAPTTCDRPPFARVSPRPVLDAAYGHLVRWIQGGEPPPSAPRIELTAVNAATAASPAVANRDARGNALGGIRLPDHAVPIGTNTGVNSGSGFCVLFGSHEPFDTATLRALYPTRQAYVDAVAASARENLRLGFIVQQDADAYIQAAQTANIGL